MRSFSFKIKNNIDRKINNIEIIPMKFIELGTSHVMLRMIVNTPIEPDKDSHSLDLGNRFVVDSRYIIKDIKGDKDRIVSDIISELWIKVPEIQQVYPTELCIRYFIESIYNECVHKLVLFDGTFHEDDIDTDNK